MLAVAAKPPKKQQQQTNNNKDTNKKDQTKKQNQQHTGLSHMICRRCWRIKLFYIKTLTCVDFVRRSLNDIFTLYLGILLYEVPVKRNANIGAAYD